MGPSNGSLLSVTGGSTTSIHIGLEPIKLKKLHSFFVAAEAACSKGDFPVVAVEAKLTAVLGLATAAAPTLLAAAVLELLSKAKGAAQPLIMQMVRANAKYLRVPSIKTFALLAAAGNVIDTSWP
ncbi:hypothetical protein [Polynucleobacter sp. JS-Polo-80-F4]|uniref:hypothetical protein n=1 Tax=Polynucleobacter sp. JS-Polo-80-F4 TaxID=2576918 RepID=UPI001C0BD9DC|nr:hypothetical protein [Polynucleobacter sp. JS-Polo-80-F4]MBU3615605.1 hypothetical protein [Polynucleobacter sp. JS-Polo-80-F4]